MRVSTFYFSKFLEFPHGLSFPFRSAFRCAPPDYRFVALLRQTWVTFISPQKIAFLSSPCGHSCMIYFYSFTEVRDGVAKGEPLRSLNAFFPFLKIAKNEILKFLQTGYTALSDSDNVVCGVALTWAGSYAIANPGLYVIQSMIFLSRTSRVRDRDFRITESFHREDFVGEQWFFGEIQSGKMKTIFWNEAPALED